MKEMWKDICGYEGCYMVSSLGRVKSLPRKINGYNRKGRLLSPYIMRGYKRVVLQKNKIVKKKFVHHIVLEEFVGSRPKGMQCCHNNGIAGDNSLENLRWDTFKNNMQDKIKHGKAYYGERNPDSRLTTTQAFLIKWLVNLKLFSQMQIAQMFGVTKTTVRHIRDGRTWSKAIKESFGGLNEK